MFVALPGARVDGHDFVRAAIDGGAVAVIASRPVGVPAVVVDDTLAAYGRLATALVRRFQDLHVVAVTGSVGKTTCKDLMGQVFARLGPTFARPGNRNSSSGMSETVSRMLADTKYFVVEMGARHIGDIADLANMVPPEVGIVLNVGVAHLGEFGSREAIAKAKGEMVEALPATGTAVLNADDPLVAGMASRTSAQVVTFGLGRNADIRADNVQIDDAGRAAFTLHTPAGSAPVRLKLALPWSRLHSGPTSPSANSHSERGCADLPM